jgi:hypothetical protein
MLRTSILLLALAACGKGDDKKSEPAPAPAEAPRKEVVTGGLNQPTGIAECDQLFAYVADYILVCDKIPHDVRQHTRANMDGMNKMIRTKLMVDPDARDELGPACTRGIVEAKQTYEENCK